MPWTVILTTLTLALISAWLVLLQGWESWQALLVVAGFAFAVIGVLMGAILIWAGRGNRAEVWCSVKTTFWKDIDLMLKQFGIRRK
jgi:hypothetical protein